MRQLFAASQDTSPMGINSRRATKSSICCHGLLDHIRSHVVFLDAYLSE
jgi:hypothetical protein